MKVFKFGGGIIKDAASVEKLGKLMQGFISENLVLVISAFGKTTNALEELAYQGFHKNPVTDDLIENIRKDHFRIVLELFSDKDPDVFEGVADFFNEIEYRVKNTPALNYDMYYDQIICYGELLSSYIVSAYLNAIGINNEYCDVRTIFKTDNHFRHASVQMEQTTELVKGKIVFDKNHKLFVTQGFIGSDLQNQSTTLGREGSDFSAAVFANILGAKEVVFWKDVAGIYNADPRRFPFARQIEKLSFDDAIKMTALGAKVLHHKTIAPLKRKKITAVVREFSLDLKPGTVIAGNVPMNREIPVIITENNMVLLTAREKQEGTNHFSELKQDEQITSNAYLSRIMPDGKYLSCLYPDREIVRELSEKYSSKFEISFRENVDVIIVLNALQEIIEKLSGDFDLLYSYEEDGHLIMIANKKLLTKG